MNNSKVKFVLLAGGVMPVRNYPNDAGVDLYLKKGNDFSLEPGEIVMESVGIKVQVADGYELQVRCRSSNGKRGLIIPNGIGTIDSGYRGEVFVLLQNNTDNTMYIDSSKAIAQGVMVKVELDEWEKVYELDKSDRGEGGFGSTDNKVGQVNVLTQEQINKASMPKPMTEDEQILKPLIEAEFNNPNS